MQLNRSIFWDTNFDTIDWQKQRGDVIDRVLHYGDINDWREIQNFYGQAIIREEILNRRYLNKKVMSFCSAIFDIPLNQFRCYNTEPSIKQHWNY